MNPKRLFVGNLAYSVKEEELWGLFSRYGEVTSVKIIEGKGYGFVEMDSYDDARKVRNTLNETEFQGRNLLIDDVRPPKRKEPVYNPDKRFSRGQGHSQKWSQKPNRQNSSLSKKRSETDQKTDIKREKSLHVERNYPEKKLNSIPRPNSVKKPETEGYKGRKPSIKSDNVKKKKESRLWPGGRGR
jgi:RNA recognition motif-containing protein